MRFLADESCDFSVVRAVRAAGHDVVAVLEVAPGATDTRLIELAVRERRLFITEDRDFGRLVYAASKPTPGVILLRFPSKARAALPATVLEVLARYGQKLEGRFVVLQPGRLRLGGGVRR
jgi:predicted nuclease of predicted toxin-antitoxin system